MVAKALEQSGHRDVIFVGHELTPKSRQLLERGLMDYIIAHDFEAELAQAVRWIQESGTGFCPDPAPSQILICTRYNCGL